MEAPAYEMEATMDQTSGPKMMYGTTQLLLRSYFSRPYINKMADVSEHSVCSIFLTYLPRKMADVRKSSLAFGFMAITNEQWRRTYDIR
jgi:hypothetical protein